MKTLIEYIAEAKKGGYALGHFNFSDLATLKGIVIGFEKAQKDVSRETALIVGLSEGERDFVGSRQAVSLIKSYREAGIPVFLNADHTKSLEKAIEAAKAGFDAVLFDAGREPIEENIKRTKEAVAAIRNIDPEIVAEGELGFLGEGSRILSVVPENADWSPEKMTTPEETARFVEETKV
ncbi:MAG TPA: class II fructose-bisphosphate aldolase, partial [Candidatus Colwellbacteria bacterium]|nr:class II fructose-bisphosphate aldolase [Candidatus Colwellbacteria bacterium]